MHTSGKKLLFAAFFLSILLISSVSMVSANPVRRGVEVYVSGPREVFVNQTVSYRVEVGGTFSRSAVNWSLEVRETPGVEISPMSSRSNTTSSFRVNITARKAGNIPIVFRGFCSDDEEIRYGETTFEVKSIKPVRIEVDVTNPDDIDLTNVKVGVFVQGKLRGSHSIPELGAGETKRVSIDWSKDNLARGEHSLEIWVDYGYTDNDFVKDEMILTSTFYITGETFFSRYSLPITITVIGASFAVFYYYMRKKQKRRRPW